MEKKLILASFEELNQAELMSTDGGCIRKTLTLIKVLLWWGAFNLPII